MCGIAGVVGPRGAPLEALGEMGRLLAHRGPDGQNYCVGFGDNLQVAHELEPLIPPRRDAPVVGFAHRRLTIIDLTDASSQPMTSADGRVVLSYNGEIYNYRELRTELESLGHEFRTTGDTEALLLAYEQWGTDCVQHLIGMWAFALVDMRKGIVFLSRDRLGIKPLFLAPLADGALAFASEIKALLATPGLTVEPNAAVAKLYMLTGIVDDRRETFFTGIERVMPGENVVIPIEQGTAGMKREPFWSLPSQPGPPRPDAADELRALLEDAIRIHLRSDVPLGTCLSGGIDSSGIVGICSQLRASGEIPHYTHHAFGYVPPSGSYSEEPYMRAAADRSGAELTVVQPTDDQFQESLLSIVRTQDEPFGSLSMAAQWWVFKAAREGGMTVMLDGQGADEIFAGYHHYLIAKAANLLRGGRLLAYAGLEREHRRFYGKPALSRATWARSTPLRRVMKPPRGTHGGDPAPAPSALLAGSLAAADADEPPLPRTLHEVLVQQTTRTSLPSLLRFEDRNSMVHSIEGRVPYLDHRVVELAFQLPEDAKLDGVMPKAVLRNALRDVLPSEVLDRRDKIGFRADTTATHAFAQQHGKALLETRTEYEREWIDHDALQALMASPDRSDIAEYTLWRAANLKLWLRMSWGDGELL